MSGAKHKRKGARVEREIVTLHQTIGIHAERVPLSGASHYQQAGHDVDIYPFGTDECPFVFEVKARKGADGFRMLDRWLSNAEGLFLRPDGDKPLVVLSWDSWVRLLEEIQRWQHAPRKRRPDAILGKREERAGGGGSDGASQTNGSGAGITKGSARPSPTALNRGE